MEKKTEEIAFLRGWEDAESGNGTCPYQDPDLVRAWRDGVWQYLDAQRWF